VAEDQDDAFGGERVLWTGQPTRSPVFDRVDVLLTLVGIYCIAGATYSLITGSRAGQSATVILSVFIILCVLIAVIGRPLLRRANLRTTCYLLTETRIVIRSTTSDRIRQAIHLRDLSPPQLTQRDDANIGTIRFKGSTLVLLEVENARLVQQLITTAQADAA
jgi:hypothetical protein